MRFLNQVFSTSQQVLIDILASSRQTNASHRFSTHHVDVCPVRYVRNAGRNINVRVGDIQPTVLMTQRPQSTPSDGLQERTVQEKWAVGPPLEQPVDGNKGALCVTP